MSYTCRNRNSPPIMDMFGCCRCRFYRMSVVPHCRLAGICMFLNAVASGHPFIEAITADGSYAVVTDVSDRGEDYIRKHLPPGYREVVR